jgi:hypothetical protein
MDTGPGPVKEVRTNHGSRGLLGEQGMSMATNQGVGSALDGKTRSVSTRYCVHTQNS